MRYGVRLGCKYGQPHEMKVLHENLRVKWEVCLICNKKYRFNKARNGRVNNTEYLKIHVRNFAQRDGATKRVYNKVYHPERCIIKI